MPRHSSVCTRAPVLSPCTHTLAGLLHPGRLGALSGGVGPQLRHHRHDGSAGGAARRPAEGTGDGQHRQQGTQKAGGRRVREAGEEGEGDVQRPRGPCQRGVAGAFEQKRQKMAAVHPNLYVSTYSIVSRSEAKL
eukprot:356506-Chlamydomonas_euryale.AAC.1